MREVCWRRGCTRVQGGQAATMDNGPLTRFVFHGEHSPFAYP